jgi:hypothetical protein
METKEGTGTSRVGDYGQAGAFWPHVLCRFGEPVHGVSFEPSQSDGQAAQQLYLLINTSEPSHVFVRTNWHALQRPRMQLSVSPWHTPHPLPHSHDPTS